MRSMTWMDGLAVFAATGIFVLAESEVTDWG